MVSGIKPLIKSDIWATIYPQKSIDILKGKKQENIVDLLGALAINGIGTTADIATFLENIKFPEEEDAESKPELKFQYALDDMNTTESKLKYHDYIRNNFNRLLTGRLKYFHGGTKKIKNETPKRYSNPIDLGYVVITAKPENAKGKLIPHYFLTLKGFLLVVGYELNPSELKSMIDNASKISSFFCFIKTVMDNSSVDFVADIFIKPMQKVLLRTDMFQGGKMDFYFGNFADAISESLLNKMKTINENRKQSIQDKPESYFSEKVTSEYMQLHPTRTFTDLIRIKKRDELHDVDDLIRHFRLEGIGSLMDNVFDSTNPREDWYDSLFDYFYPSKESNVLFLKFGYDSEIHLMNRVMQSISNTFTYFEYGLLNYTPKKLPRLKAWKKHQKYKKPDKAFFKKYGTKFKPKPDFDLSHLD